VNKAFRIAVAGLLLVGGGASAHHSPLAVFDMKRAVEINGTFTKVNWVNPHIFFEVAGKDLKGKAATWKFESQPPAFFARAGLRKKDLTAKIGQPVRVTLNAAVDGSPIGWAKLFVFQDGTKIQLGGL
jgi:hypothetical protein